MTNAQEWLDNNYPKEGVCKLEKDSLDSPNKNYNKAREEITELEIDREEIDGTINITGFPNLQELDISNNELITELNISECQKLVKIFCSYNKKLTILTLPKNNQIQFLVFHSNGFTNLKWTGDLNYQTLTKLIISEHDFSKQDLSVLSRLVNLNTGFSGSLKPLEKLTKLLTLEISNTKFAYGLEYLPASLEKIYCDNVKRLQEQLGENCERRHLQGDEYVNFYDYQEWRKTHQKLISQTKEISELKKVLENLSLTSRVFWDFSTPESVLIAYNENQKNKTFWFLSTVFFLQTERTIKELEKANQEYYRNVLLKEPKELKEKILNFYLSLPEKELLQELIIAYLEYSKSKQQNFSSYKLRKKCDAIKEKLENKLNKEEVEEFMDKVEIISKDCDKLVENELELENKFNLGADLKQSLDQSKCQIQILPK